LSFFNFYLSFWEPPEKSALYSDRLLTGLPDWEIKDIHKKLVLLLIKPFLKTFHFLNNLSPDVAVLGNSIVSDSFKVIL